MEVDITIQDSDDPEKTEMIKNSIYFVQNALQLNPALKAVILFLKQLLWNYQLNDLYTGGISSYSLMIMLCCSTNQHQQYLGVRSVDILTSFLEFYTNRANL